MATLIDPGWLSGLKQASYVTQCLTEGQSREEIAVTLGGDMQLVAVWLSSLRHNHWMIVDDKGWALLPRGRLRRVDYGICLNLNKRIIQGQYFGRVYLFTYSQFRNAAEVVSHWIVSVHIPVQSFLPFHP
jgi:hypothetical protein